MTNEEFRKSLSKEQLRFLRNKYKDSLNEVEDLLDWCGQSPCRDNLTYVGDKISLASVYKDLLGEDSLNILFLEYYKRYESMYENI